LWVWCEAPASADGMWIYGIPPSVLLLVFAAIAIAIIVVVLRRGEQSKSSWFQENVAIDYELMLPVGEIDQFYDLKEKILSKAADEAAVNGVDPGVEITCRTLPEHAKQILKNALMTRMVKDIDRLVQVQKDKPGNYRLWHHKLVSERYYASLCDAERELSEEIDCCLEEAEEIEPGWKEQVFQNAVYLWRQDKARQHEKKEVKKQVINAKKEIVREVKKKDTDAQMMKEKLLKEQRAAEKAMEKLLKEEERQEADSKKKKKGGGASEPPVSGSKTKKKK